MISPVVTIAKRTKEKKQIKTKIGVGSVVKAKVGEMEVNTREGSSTRTGKDVVGCVHNMLGQNKLLVKFEDGQKKKIGFSSLCVFMFKIRG